MVQCSTIILRDASGQRITHIARTNENLLLYRCFIECLSITLSFMLNIEHSVSCELLYTKI